MTRLVLHIGPHKTGTTALQSFFARNRIALRAAGVHYPPEWQGFLLGHHQLVDDIKRWTDEAAQQEIDSARATIGGMASSAPCVLLSSEDFVYLGPDELGTLADVLGDHETEVIYFVRGWADLIPSVWQEEIKRGSTVPLSEYIAGLLVDPEQSDVLDYRRVVGRFAAAFGQASLTLVSYDYLLSHGIDIADYFVTAILGVRLSAEPETTLTNVSWSPERLELVRALNVVARSRGLVPDARWPRAAFTERDRDQGHGAAAVKRGLLRFVRTLEVPREPAGYTRSIDALLSTYGDRVLNAQERRLSPPGEPRIAEYVDEGYLNDDDLVVRIARIYESLPPLNRG